MIYLDHNATTPVLPEVVEEIRETISAVHRIAGSLVSAR